MNPIEIENTCFGCDIEEFMDSIRESTEVHLALKHGDDRLIRNAYEMVAMSLISDAQDMMLRDCNRARQIMNLVKHVLSEVHENPAALERRISEE